MEETPNPKINLIVSTETSIKQKQMGLVEVPLVLAGNTLGNPFLPASFAQYLF